MIARIRRLAATLRDIYRASGPLRDWDGGPTW